MADSKRSGKKQELTPSWDRLASDALAGKALPLIKDAEAPPPSENETEADYALRLKQQGATHRDIATLLGRTGGAVTAKLSHIRDKAKLRTEGKRQPKKRAASKPHDTVLAQFVESSGIDSSKLIKVIVALGHGDQAAKELSKVASTENVLAIIAKLGLAEPLLNHLLAKAINSRG